MRPAIVLLLAVSTRVVFAQQPEAFEVTSLKQSLPETRLNSRLNGALFICNGHTLMQLIQSSYPELPAWRVLGGPRWITTDTWDLTAKLPAGMPVEQEALYRKTEAMLKTFLAEEFKLKTHEEMREAPVYWLVARNPKLKPTAFERSSIQPVPQGYEFHRTSMAELAGYLYSYLTPRGSMHVADRPVIDKTGLSEFYDFTLEWKPETAQPDPTAPSPSLFAAIEQLGLKLQPEKALVPFVVIDQAERPPKD